MMVDMGVDVNGTPKGRPNALHAAVRSGDNVMIQYLVDHGADFSSKDAFGRTPLEEADFEAPKSTIELMHKLAAEAAAKKKP